MASRRRNCWSQSTLVLRMISARQNHPFRVDVSFSTTHDWRDKCFQSIFSFLDNFDHWIRLTQLYFSHFNSSNRQNHSFFISLLGRDVIRFHPEAHWTANRRNTSYFFSSRSCLLSEFNPNWILFELKRKIVFSLSSRHQPLFNFMLKWIKLRIDQKILFFSITITVRFRFGRNQTPSRWKIPFTFLFSFEAIVHSQFKLNSIWILIENSRFPFVAIEIGLRSPFGQHQTSNPWRNSLFLSRLGRNGQSISIRTKSMSNSNKKFSFVVDVDRNYRSIKRRTEFNSYSKKKFFFYLFSIEIDVRFHAELNRVANGRENPFFLSPKSRFMFGFISILSEFEQKQKILCVSLFSNEIAVEVQSELNLIRTEAENSFFLSPCSQVMFGFIPYSIPTEMKQKTSIFSLLHRDSC